LTRNDVMTVTSVSVRLSPGFTESVTVNGEFD